MTRWVALARSLGEPQPFFRVIAATTAAAWGNAKLLEAAVDETRQHMDQFVLETAKGVEPEAISSTIRNVVFGVLGTCVSRKSRFGYGVDGAEWMLSFNRSGIGKSLILIHGFLGGKGVWLPQQIGFKSAFDAVSVDLPGFGGSPIGKSPDGMQGFVADLIALADNLRLERFSLLGWSFGGMIAQQTALDYPERIERLVLSGTASVGELPERFETWSETLSHIASGGVEATLDRTVRTWFVRGEADPFFEICRQACDGASAAACTGAIQAMRPWRVTERLREIRQPTLIIVGDRDRSTSPKDAFALWQGLPSANLCVLPNCAHGAHMECPDLFNRVVAEFLTDTLL